MVLNAHGIAIKERWLVSGCCRVKLKADLLYVHSIECMSECVGMSKKVAECREGHPLYINL